MSVLTPERTLPVTPMAPFKQAEPAVVKPPVDRETQILIDARALLEKGWIQGTRYWHDENGVDYYCAHGAINKAAFNSWASATFHFGIHRRLRRFIPDDMSLVAFNDTRSKEEVLALFDRAIQG